MNTISEREIVDYRFENEQLVIGLAGELEEAEIITFSETEFQAWASISYDMDLYRVLEDYNVEDEYYSGYETNWTEFYKNLTDSDISDFLEDYKKEKEMKELGVDGLVKFIKSIKNN